MKKLFLLLILSLFSAQSFAGSCPDGSEPIVCSPVDAFKCFMGTELDFLVIGNCWLSKVKQRKSLVEDYKEKYELD